MKKVVLILLSLMTFASFANGTDSTGVDSLNIRNLYLFGGVDMYYLYDFNEPYSQSRPGFEYSHTRANQMSMNTGIFGFGYEDNKVRGKIGLIFGDYANSNYAGEPVGLRNIMEAVVGFNFAPRLWFDAGVFGSHIGFEAAFGPENPTLTRSIVANSSPFFETGAKLTYTPSEDWVFTALVLNGWQNIQDNNANKALGTQITFKPKSNITLNSSTFLGEGYNNPDTTKIRFFHNFYTLIDVNDSIHIAFQFDCGVEEGNGWYGFTLIGRQDITNRLIMVGRVEYFKDKSQITYVTNTPNGFEVGGASVGVDYKITHNVLFRTEAKVLFSPDDIFEKGTGVHNQDVVWTTSLSFNFNR